MSNVIYFFIFLFLFKNDFYIFKEDLSKIILFNINEVNSKNFYIQNNIWFNIGIIHKQQKITYKRN